jgi:hypothetical protein
VRVEHDQWLDEPAAAPLARGLARNPAAPAEVLLRLLDTHEADAAGGLRWHPRLPAAVVGAMLRHPSPRVRAALAGQHRVDPAIRHRLPALPGFPTAGLGRFTGDPDPAVRALVARDPHADPAVVDRLAGDPDPAVRRATAGCPPGGSWRCWTPGRRRPRRTRPCPST